MKIFIFVLILIGLCLIIYITYTKKIRKKTLILTKQFPENWRMLLNEHVQFYTQLDSKQKEFFEKRILLFFGTKKITAISTEIDDTVKLLVASSAIIPMFAFPNYNYPKLKEVLIYPKNFSRDFQTHNLEGEEEDAAIIGMVGNRFMNGTMILSKPDLLRAYNSNIQVNNVGIHEFIHLIDMEDGLTDGIPEILINNSYVAPWLALIKEEMTQIEKGESDINPYALTNNAEFLAVVSEYFFDNPEKFEAKHPELYAYLNSIFKQN